MKKLNTLKQTATKVISAAAQQVKANVQAVKTGNTGVIKQTASQATALIKNTELLPLLPLVPVMKNMLQRRGIATEGRSLYNLTMDFYSQIVNPSGKLESDVMSFENLIGAELVKNPDNFETLDEANTKAQVGQAVGQALGGGKQGQGNGEIAAGIGAGAGAAVGAAAGIPPQAGAAIGSTIAKIVRAVILFIKSKKDSGNPEVSEALDAAGRADIDKLADEHLNDATTTEDSAGLFTTKNILIGVVGLILLFIIAKKVI